MISESESVALFIDRIDRIDATEDLELSARFDPFIDSGFSEEQPVDFFNLSEQGSVAGLRIVG